MSFCVNFVHLSTSASNQPVDHILQFCEPCGASGQENHRARLFMLLHSCKDASGPPEQSISWFSQWCMQESCLHWYIILFCIIVTTIILVCYFFLSGACRTASLKWILLAPTCPVNFFFLFTFLRAYNVDTYFIVPL